MHADAPDPETALEALRASLDGRLTRAGQPAPFPGAPATRTWLLTWTGGRLHAGRVEVDGVRTDSSWIALDVPALDRAAWIRIATRVFAPAALAERVPHRRALFRDPALDGAYVQGLAPGPDEWSALHGPSPAPRPLEDGVRASDALAARLRPVLAAALPALRALGDFVIEIEDGTVGVRFPLIFAGLEDYRRALEAVNRLVSAMRG